jgi:hypothetical protein
MYTENNYSQDVENAWEFNYTVRICYENGL